MAEEFLFQLKANSELIRKFWWVYTLIILICIFTVYAAKLLKKQDNNQLVPFSLTRNELDRPLTYFIGVVIGLINLAIAYSYSSQSNLTPPRIITLAQYGLYQLGGKYAVCYFWGVFVLVFFVLGVILLCHI